MEKIIFDGSSQEVEMKGVTFNNLPQAIEKIIIKLGKIEEILKDKEFDQIIYDNSDLFNISELAEYLTLSVNTLYGMVSRRKIPFMKKSKRLYFKKKEIDAWLSVSKHRVLNH